MNKDDNKQPQGEIANESYREKEPFSYTDFKQIKKEQEKNKQVNANQNNANDKPNIPPTNPPKK